MEWNNLKDYDISNTMYQNTTEDIQMGNPLPKETYLNTKQVRKGIRRAQYI